MLWLMVGGPEHGTWKDIDESLFHYGTVLLPDYTWRRMDQVMGWDHTPRMVPYRKQRFDVYAPHQPGDVAYMTVLLCGSESILELEKYILDALQKAIGW